MVRERFRPEGIHFEHRRLDALALGGFQCGLTQAEGQNGRNQRGPEHQTCARASCRPPDREGEPRA